MGREIRRVPANWEHPRKENGDYKSMYDKDFHTALMEWLKEYSQWRHGKHPDQLRHPEEKDMVFSEWIGGPPDPDYYRPSFTSEPTWYQVYQTVSEGYPVTPPFETQAELVDYLVKYGDDWDQSRGEGGWSREAAESFVGHGWAPSGMLIPGRGFITARDGFPD